MEKAAFSTTIEASVERVWNVLWEDETYRIWTSVFAEGSHAVSDWEEGSRVTFFDGKGDGMYSLIAKLIPNELMLFHHQGSIKDGAEIPFEGEMANWSDSAEEYRLVDNNGITELTIEIDMVEEFKAFLNEKFPLALAKVKELSES